MKILDIKKASIVFLLLFSSSLAFSQNVPIDFEEGGNGADWTWTVFENVTNPELEIVDNPDMSGINTSSTVAKFTALDEGAPWAGCESMHGSDIGTFTLNAETSTITIMVWKSVISNVGIKLVENSSASLGELLVSNTLTDQWEELTFNFSSMIGIEYDQIVVFPDFQERDSDNIIYFDNISFGEEIEVASPMTAAPDPTIPAENVISMFSNVYTDVTVDTWLTDWSAALLEDIQIESNDTKKYSNVDFLGIETVGDNLLDISEMLNLHLDMWTPNMTTFRVKLVDFGADGMFEGGDDSEHEIIIENPNSEEWNSIMIPLSDFTGLTSMENIAQMIYSGNPAGAGVLYIDNVYFSTEVVDIEEVDPLSISIFPNPTQGIININSEEKIESITIYDALGKMVFSESNFDLGSRVDVSELNNGTYIIEVQTEDGITSSRLIIE